MSLVNRVAEHEGFKSKPYIDPLVARNPEAYGISATDMEIIKNNLDKLTLTFGNGFTFLTEDESKLVLESRLKSIAKELDSKIPGFTSLPIDIQQMLTEMAYQLGVTGLLKFKHMLSAIEDRDWCDAYREGFDSRWARQTPKRAREVLKPVFDRCQNSK